MKEILQGIWKSEIRKTLVKISANIWRLFLMNITKFSFFEPDEYFLKLSFMNIAIDISTFVHGKTT